MALGSGIIIAAILMNLAVMSFVDLRVEEQARRLGMVYPDEVRVLFEEERDGF